MSQPGQEGLSWLLTATTQAGALRPTEVSAKAGTGDQDANVFTALECYLAELVARPPGCTESESPPSKRQHDSVATSDEELAARRCTHGRADATPGNHGSSGSCRQALQTYAALTTSASRGAVRDVTQVARSR